MVAYLKKPEGSEGFHQIVDFLNATHIREIELTATIDGTVMTVTEAFVRRHLQLADADGISSLPTTEIFKQLSLMGVKDQHTQESMVPQPRSPTQTPVADEIVYEDRGDSFERDATTATSLEAEQGSGGSTRHQDTILGDRPAQTRFERLFKQFNDSPLLRVNTLRSDEGSMTQQELMVFCTTMSNKVESLKTDLKQTKQIYGAAYTRLIKKVKKLEKIVKSSQARRRARIVVSDDEDDLEDPSKQGRKIAEIDQDPGISLVQHDAEIQGRYGHDMEFDFDFDAAKEVSTAEKDVSTAEPVSTAGAVVTTASVASATKDKGKGKIDESENVKTKTKLQQEQERLDFETYRGLQAEEREKYTEAEQARMLAELINQRKRYFAAQRAEERRNKPPTQAQQRTYMSNYIKHMGGYTLQQLKGYSFDEIKTLFKTTIRSVNTFVPIESEKVTEPFLRFTLKALGSTERSSKLGNHTKVHQFFDDMLKAFDMDDLVTLWSLVKEKFNSIEPTDGKEREIWVDASCVYKGGNRHLHVGRERVSIVKGNSYIDVGRKASCRSDNKMSEEVTYEVIHASLGEDCWELKVFILSTAKSRVSTAQDTTASTNQLVLLEQVSIASYQLKIELNPFKDVLVFRKMVDFLGAIPINLKGNMWESEDLIENKTDWKMPPKERDGAWHIKMEMIDPDGEKFNRIFQSIPTTRKLSEKKSQVISSTWNIFMIPRSGLRV
ncbi:hypothetical protein Tco_1531328 [Tanacetum coccineum]